MKQEKFNKGMRECFINYQLDKLNHLKKRLENKEISKSLYNKEVKVIHNALKTVL